VVGFAHGADSGTVRNKIRLVAFCHIFSGVFRELVEAEVRALDGKQARAAGLNMQEAVPPSDLHLDADFDQLEELEKSKGAATQFLKKMKK
jgi:hypothetical protein